MPAHNLPPQDYYATAAHFDRQAAKAKYPERREDMRRTAAEYREKARQQAEQRKRAGEGTEATATSPGSQRP